MKEYAIKFKGHQQFGEHDWEYYTGDRYTVNHELYAVASNDKKDAKPYTSEKRAENAVNGLYEKCTNVANTRVVELKQ